MSKWIFTKLHRTPKCRGRNAAFFGDIHKEFFGSIRQLDPYGIALIKALLSISGPSTIIRLVVTIVFFAIDRLSMWTWTHVVKKILKGMKPSVAHLDAASAVVFIGMIGWVKAASLHVAPRLVLTGFRHAVNGVSIYGLLALKAATAPGGLSTKCATINKFDVSAITDTLPHSPAVTCSIASDNKEATDFLSGHIDDFHMASIHPTGPQFR